MRADFLTKAEQMSKDFVAKLLASVQEHVDANAIVAGGWARDTHLGLEPKDVDIWLHSPQHWQTVKRKIERDVLQGVANLCVLMPNTVRAAGWCLWIMKATYEDVRVDFICFHEPLLAWGANVLAQFDIGICAIGWDGKSEFTKTPAFTKDLQNKTLTYNAEGRGLEDLPRVVYDHLPRLLKKFPDFVPVGFPTDVEAPGKYDPADFKVHYE